MLPANPFFARYFHVEEELIRSAYATTPTPEAMRMLLNIQTTYLLEAAEKKPAPCAHLNISLERK